MSAERKWSMLDLNERQRKFVLAYIENGCNATKAAKAAGYTGTEESIWVQGSRLLSNVKVRAVMEVELDKVKLTKTDAVRLLTEHAKVNIADFQTTEGSINKTVFRKKGYLVKGCRVSKRMTEDGNVIEDSELKLVDSQRAIELLAKIGGWIVDKSEVTGSNGGPIQFVGLTVDPKEIAL